jgi:chaperone required for assembly of F1-ATPase
VEALAPLPLTALHAAVTAAGSLVIGLALTEGRLAPEAAWKASQLDESFQIERWGEDPEAARQRAALRRDIEDARRFLDLLRE